MAITTRVPEWPEIPNKGLASGIPEVTMQFAAPDVKTSILGKISETYEKTIFEVLAEQLRTSAVQSVKVEIKFFNDPEFYTVQIVGGSQGCLLAEQTRIVEQVAPPTKRKKMAPSTSAPNSPEVKNDNSIPVMEMESAETAEKPNKTLTYRVFTLIRCSRVECCSILNSIA